MRIKVQKITFYSTSFLIRTEPLGTEYYRIEENISFHLIPVEYCVIYVVVYTTIFYSVWSLSYPSL